MNGISTLLILSFVFACGAAEQDVETKSVPAVEMGPNWDSEDTSLTESLDTIKQQLEKMPIGSEARRLSVDAIMLATVAGDTASANGLKGQLLQQYPRSLEASYVLTQFADAKSLREFLDQQFLKDLSTTERAVLATRVIRMVFSKHKKGLLEDEAFALRLARAAFIAEERSMCNDCMAVLKDRKKQVASVACDELTSASERFKELQTLTVQSDFASLVADIHGFQIHLTQSMTDDEKNSTEIRRIMARNHLVAGELDTAIGQFEFLAKSCDDAQFLFQHGVCLARLKRVDEARSVLQRLSSMHPDSAWCSMADAVSSYMQDLDGTLDRYAELLAKVIAAYRDLLIEVCELEVCWTPQSGNDVTISLGIDMPRNFFELMAQRRQLPIFGVRCQGEESAVYLKDEPAIYRLPKTSFIPSPELADCKIDEKGHFHGSAKFSTGNSAIRLQSTIRDLLHNEKLCSKTAMKVMVSGLVRSGTFPLPLVADGTQRMIRFASVDVDRPRMLPLTINLGSDDLVVSATAEYDDFKLQLRKLFAGGRKDHRLTPENWPKLPTKTLGEKDFGTMTRLFGMAAQLFFEERKPTESAGKPDPSSEPLR